ncbi:uncharacterized protein PSFLO_06053 [Pseudozyma flocculosa]|uniref:DUF6604 domain-containing protein n=1 Tax=Pseudozyma flocculosa TaxID=84751 RepID=A0A5C3FAV1_9BASI|nr:uncharacterized protein PSFLO_06053 [Pseudozyma flocculosa]
MGASPTRAASELRSAPAHAAIFADRAHPRQLALSLRQVLGRTVSLGFPCERFTAAENHPAKSISAAHCEQTKPAAQQYKYIVRIPQFVELAQFIADRGYAVPADKLQLVTRCISRRMACLRFYERDGQVCTRHVYFVEVLHKILDIPQSFEQPRSQQQPQQQHSASRKKATRNRKKGKSKKRGTARDAQVGEDVSNENLFGCLELQSNDEEEGDDDDAADDEELHYGVEDSVDEAVCAYLVFYTDLNDIRRFLCLLWSEYRRRKADLVSASIATTTAFLLVEKAFADIQARYRGLFAGPKELLTALASYAVELRTGGPLLDGDGDGGGISGLIYSSYADLGPKAEAWAMAEDYFCIRPWFLFDAWHRDPEAARDVPMTDEDFDHKAAPGSPSPRSQEQRRGLDIHILFTALHDALTLEMSRFLRGTEGPSLLLAFELQAFIDINLILRHDKRRARFEAKKCLDKMRDSLDEAKRSRCRLELKVPISNEDGLDAMDELIQKLLRELKSRSTLVDGRESDGEGWSTAARDRFLDRHPVYLSKELKGQKLSWTDTDLILRLHGSKKLFGSDAPPTDLAESSISLMRLYGYTERFINDFLYGSAPRMNKALKMDSPSELGMRLNRLSSTSKFFEVFLAMLHTCRGCADADPGGQLTDDPMQSLYNELVATQPEGAGKNLFVDAISTATAADTTVPIIDGRPNFSRSERKRGPRRRLALVDLVQFQASSLIVGMPDLCFDYVALNTRCSRVFEAVYAALQADRKSLNPDPGYPHNGRSLETVFTTLVIVGGTFSKNRKKGGVLAPMVQRQKEALLRVARAMLDKLTEVGEDAGYHQLYAGLITLGAYTPDEDKEEDEDEGGDEDEDDDGSDIAEAEAGEQLPDEVTTEQSGQTANPGPRASF